jgi:ABC-type transport system substrate-binding protein/DNA-binding SARP family transcriptional activator/streptogramin lyase
LGDALRVFLAGRVAIETESLVPDDVRFPGRQGRLLFAYLVLEQGRPLPRDELAEALWGDTLPATWEKALTVLVSKLRTLLAQAGVDGTRALTSAFGCYRLELPADTWVDVVVAADSARDAERALAAGDDQQAMAAALHAESLTRSAFLPGESTPWVDRKRRELADVRWRALHALGEVYLGVGEWSRAAAWAEQAVTLEPFRETGYRLLMQAHAGAGNRAEALQIYDRCRRLLDDELGAYPSPETEEIYQRLLEAPSKRTSPAPPPAQSQPPAVPVDAESGAAQPGRPMPTAYSAVRRRRVQRLIFAVAGVAVLVGIGAGVGVTTTGSASRSARGPAKIAAHVPADSLVALDAGGSVVATVPVGAHPLAVTSAASSLWVADSSDQSVERVDPKRYAVTATIPIGGRPAALTAEGADVWVSDQNGVISRIDTQYNVATSPPLPPPFVAIPGFLTTWPMLAAYRSVWEVNPDGYLSRIDPRAGSQLASVEVGNDPSAIASGSGAIWVTNRSDGTVTRLDPSTMLTTTIPVGHGPAAVAVNRWGVWVADGGTNTLVHIDVDTNVVVGSTRIGKGADVLLATPGALWVADGQAGTVEKLDPRTGAVRETIVLGGTPSALTLAGGHVWVTVAPAPPPAPATGGVARIAVHEQTLPPMDPANGSLPQFLYALCANLVTYPDKPAPEGSQMVPEVAESVPTPTDHGRTYTFTVRSGFRFSPPSNAPVTAQTFKATIERVVNPHIGSFNATAFSGIVGYRAFVSGRASELRGVVVRGNKLIIHLVRPDGSFLANLASGAACAVPIGTPAVRGGLPFVPTAGPYYVSSYTAGQQLILKRNPNYRGERPHRLDEFVVTMGVDSAKTLSEVVDGSADYALDGLPRDAASMLLAKYGPGSAAARTGHQQYFISSADGERWLHMNTSRPLFAKLRLRRAVNYAIDRKALAALGARFTEDNPFNSGQPTDDLLPPAITGAPRLNVYPVSHPDIARARQLAGHIHATAVMYTPDVAPWIEEAQIVKADLRPIGIDVQIVQFPLSGYFDHIGVPNAPFDLAVVGWNFSNTDPGVSLGIFDNTVENGNISYFNDPRFSRQYRADNELSGPERYRAFAQLELELERDYAPVAAFTVDASRDFFSARMGCQLYQPVFGMDLAALCLRKR